MKAECFLSAVETGGEVSDDARTKRQRNRDGSPVLDQESV